MKETMKKKLVTTMKLHPISTALLLFYTIVSVMHGGLLLFTAGFLAASAAYLLECFFLVTGMIRMRRRCAGHPRSGQKTRTRSMPIMHRR